MESIAEALEAYDHLLADLPSWVAGQYNPASGGFFHAPSSRDMAEPFPDIESSTMAVDILSMLGVLPRLSPGVRERMVGFFQDRQDPATGLFLDHHPAMARDETMVARAQDFACKSLRLLGSSPRHEAGGVGALPAYLESPETAVAWMRTVELTNSWRGCDKLSWVRVAYARLPREHQAAWIEAIHRHLENTQDPHTGFWGQGRPLVRLSGTFKIMTSFYRHHPAMLPRADRIRESIFKALAEDEPEDFCWIRNPVDMVHMMGLEPSPDEWFALLAHVLEGSRDLRRPGGGFSRHRGRSPAATNVAQVRPGDGHSDVPVAVPLSLGRVEADMNATVQALRVRAMLYDLAGLRAPPLPIPLDLADRLGN